MRSVVVGFLLVLLVGALGCAAKQRVALECIPRDVRIFVDGRQLSPGTESVDLATDGPHKIYFTGGGFEPQMVVLERLDGEAGPLLAPPDVCSQTTFQPVRPDVRFELEGEDEPGPESTP